MMGGRQPGDAETAVTTPRKVLPAQARSAPILAQETFPARTFALCSASRKALFAEPFNV
jgi:hypothetical protein